MWWWFASSSGQKGCGRWEFRQALTQVEGSWYDHQFQHHTTPLTSCKCFYITLCLTSPFCGLLQWKGARDFVAVALWKNILADNSGRTIVPIELGLLWFYFIFITVLTAKSFHLLGKQQMVSNGRAGLWPCQLKSSKAGISAPHMVRLSLCSQHCFRPSRVQNKSKKHPNFTDCTANKHPHLVKTCFCLEAALKRWHTDISNISNWSGPFLKNNVKISSTTLSSRHWKLGLIWTDSASFLSLF